MPDPFAAALAAQFRAPGSAAAAYGPAATPIRVILGQPDEELRLGGGRDLVKRSVLLQIQRSDVAAPAIGDVVQLAAPLADSTAKLKLYGEPKLDIEGLTWTCAAVPA